MSLGIFASVIYFNDTPEMLERCLKAIKACNFSGLVCIDGAYAEYPLQPGETFLSTDGCTDVAKKYADVVIIPNKPWVSQMEKRTKTFKIFPVGNYLIKLDTDEFIKPGIIDTSLLTEDCYSVSMIVPIPEKPGLWDAACSPVRIHKLYEDLEYRHRHAYVYRTSKITDSSNSQSGLYLDIHSSPNIAYYTNGEPVLFSHEPGLRSKVKLMQDGEYMRNRNERRFHYEKCLKELKGKINRPQKNADGVNRQVHVKYLGYMEYHGHFLDVKKHGEIVEMPFWQYAQLIQDFGVHTWKMLK